MFDGRSEMLAADARRAALLHEAKARHLLREARQDRALGGVQASARLLALLGDLMIGGGEWLKQRSSVPAAAPCETSVQGA